MKLLKKMQVKGLLFITFILAGLNSHAQFSRYIIRLKDKAFSPYSISNPGAFLSQRALDRRTRYNIAIDSSDLPVTPRYLDSIRLAGNVTILNTSKWLNQVAIQTSDAAALQKINNFPFVINSAPLAARTSTTTIDKKLDLGETPIPQADQKLNSINNVNDQFNYGQSNGQVKIHHGDFLHNHGFMGQQMHIAMLDAGFYHYQTLPTFDSMRNNSQVLGTWDFVAGNASVNEDNTHGMQCLSTIAANIPGKFVGTAPKASFYLYRTEDVGSEYPIEEQNWAAGIERADSLGVDLCTTSLGYNQFDNPIFNYTYADMNGNTTLSAKAADMAAKKGMLMVLAAGNAGNDSWHYLITPSDADSVLCVGAVDTIGNVGSFSSYGPSSDGQVKPSVAAVGRLAVVADVNTGLPVYSSGTSFACPNMAGIATCLWQAFPEMNNMKIIQVLEASASKSGNPDDRVGYGIPDAKKAFVMLQKELFTMQANLNTNCNAQLQFSLKTDPTMTIDLERKLSTEQTYTNVQTTQDPGSYGTHDFSLTDILSNIPQGSISYRLKVTIGSDTSFYLDPVTLDYTANCIPTENNVSIHPNPVSDIVKINIARTTTSQVGIVIQNAAGQKVYSLRFTQQPGVSVSPVSMSHMSRGVYFVSIFIDNKKESTRKILRQ